MANPGGKYNQLKIDAEIEVPSKEAVYKRLAEVGIIHVIKKGELMTIIAKKVGDRYQIPNLTTSRIYKISDFLISYNKKVNKSFKKQLMPESPVYIPEKLELETAIG